MKAVEPPRLSDSELLEKRARLRRGLRRANSAAVVVLLIVLLLASVAILQVNRIHQSAAEARQARALAREELWNSQAAQARAELASGSAGQSVNALKAVSAAAKLRPSLELRSLAIAAFSLSDIQESSSKPLPPGATFAVFSPSLQEYAVGFEDGSVQVIETASGRSRFFLEGGMRPLHLVFSPDGNYLAGRFGGRIRKVWDLRSTNLVVDVNLPPGDLPNTMDFSVDSRMIAFSSRDTLLRFHELPSGRPLPPLDLQVVPRGFSLNPDGVHLAVSWSSQVQVWNLRTRARLQTLTLKSMAGDLKWHPDGVRLAVAERSGEISVFDTYSESSLVLRGHLANPGSLQFNPQGTLLLSSALDLTTRLWNVEDGECEWVSRNLLNAQFSSDGRAVAYGHRGQSLGFCQVREPLAYTLLSAPMNSGALIRSLDFSPDDRLLAATTPNMVLVWDVQSRRLVDAGRMTDLNTVAFTQTAQQLVTAGANGLMRFALQTNAFSGDVRVLQSRPLEYFFHDPIPRLHAAPGTNGWALVSIPEQPLSLFNLQTPEKSFAFPQPISGRRLALSAHAQFLAASHEQRTDLTIFDASNGRALFSSEEAGLAVQFSPDNRWLATRLHKEFSLLKVGSWKPACSLPTELPINAPAGVAFSPDGRYFAYTPRHGMIRLAEPATGALLAEFPTRSRGVVQSLAFNRAGDRLAVATGNRLVEIWNIPELRTALAALHLNWPEVATPTAASDLLSLAEPEVSRWRVLLPLLGAVVALGFGLYAFRYQQQLLQGYQEVDALAALRNRELQQAQAELLHSQKMKALGTLAAGIAHDFNNLLSVIRLSSDFLRRGTKDRTELLEEVEAIQQAVDKGKQVVHSMLGYSRNQSESRAPLQIAELVEDTVGLLSRQFLSGIQLVMELDRKAPRVRVPRIRLEQMFLNLVVNASEAMRGQGRLVVILKHAPFPLNAVLLPAKAKDYLALSVADTGSGIPPEILDRIFEPFFTTKDLGANPGTGLGLATLYRIAQEEGFGIQVESSPGQGTCFTIVIPVVEDDPSLIPLS